MPDVRMRIRVDLYLKRTHAGKQASRENEKTYVETGNEEMVGRKGHGYHRFTGGYSIYIGTESTPCLSKSKNNNNNNTQQKAETNDSYVQLIIDGESWALVASIGRRQAGRPCGLADILEPY